MATTPTLLSIDQYLHTSYKPDVHFVDGEIEERNVGERTHSSIQKFITDLFTKNEDIWKMEAIFELRIRIGSSRVRVCDVTIVSNDAPWEEVVTTPPVACIEVMSPEDRLSRAEKVLADYFEMGVQNIWLIDPYKRKAYTFTSTGFHEIEPTILKVPASPIQIDLTDLFAKLDKKTATSRQ